METTICLPSSILSNPLFSTLVTLSLLILLYFPSPLLTTFLFPLLISTSILLFLLRFGTSQRLKPNNGSPHRIETRMPIELDQEAQPETVIINYGSNDEKTVAKAAAPCSWVDPRPSNEPEPQPGWEQMGLSQSEKGVDPHYYCYGVQTRTQFEPEPESLTGLGIGSNQFCGKTFVGWEVGAPLEVIYEAHDGEEEEDEDNNDAFQSNGNCTDKINRYPSLSRCYPESDSDSDSECSSSSWEGELWDGDEGREELIEIALDCYGDHKGIKKIVYQEVQVDDDDDDEDNLIEIDISPTRSNSGFCW